MRLEYDNGPVKLKLGDLYEIWGRGLVLNSVDDQSIDRDTGIRGLTLVYSNPSFSTQFIAGKTDISQSTINALGFNFNTCLQSSEPIDPPAPVTKTTLFVMLVLRRL